MQELKADCFCENHRHEAVVVSSSSTCFFPPQYLIDTISEVIQISKLNFWGRWSKFKLIQI